MATKKQSQDMFDALKKFKAALLDVSADSLLSRKCNIHTNASLVSEAILAKERVLNLARDFSEEEFATHLMASGFMDTSVHQSANT